MELENRFIEAMANLGISRDSRCLVAFSGGGDSTALLELCHQTAKTAGRHYTALRVRHGIRTGAEEDTETAFCRDFCSERRIPFTEITG